MKDLVRIELYKIIKRKDFLLMLSMIFIPIMYGVGLASNSHSFSYDGTSKVTALGYASEMMVFVYMCFIYFVILSVCVIRSLKGEVENKSILLYVQRINNRKIIYFSKMMAYGILQLIITAIFILVSVICYKVFLVQRKDIASGLFYQNDEMVQIICTVIAILLCFIFTITVSLFLSAWLKSFQAMGVFIFLWLGLMYVKEFGLIKYLAPIYYVENIIDSSTSINSVKQLLYLAVLVATVSIICATSGSRKFLRSDLC